MATVLSLLGSFSRTHERTLCRRGLNVVRSIVIAFAALLAGANTAWGAEAKPVIRYIPAAHVFTIGNSIGTISPTSTGGVVATWSILPALPAGLNFNAITGQISGTPTVVSLPTAYTVKGTNTRGSATTALLITVKDLPPIIGYTPSAYIFTKGTSIPSIQPTSSGGRVLLFSILPKLPSGLAFNVLNGQITGTPTALSPTRTYTVGAVNLSGISKTTVTISVDSQALPPVIAYNPSTYTLMRGVTVGPITPASSGGAVTSYSVSPALPVGLGLSPATGVISGTPTAVTATATYTVMATGTGGSTTASLTLSVVAPPPTPVISSFSASPAAIASGTETTLSWVVSGASSLSLDQGIGDVTGLTSRNIAPAATTTFTLTATNTARSSVTAQTTVTVVPAPAITTFAADRPMITAGESTNLSATFSGGAGLITPGSLQIISGGSVSVNPQVTMAYTLTVTPSVGAPAIRTVTVTVSSDSPPSLLTPSISYAPEGVTITNNISDADGVRNITYLWSEYPEDPKYEISEGSPSSITVSMIGTFNTRTTAETLNGSTGVWTLQSSPVISFTWPVDFPSSIQAPMTSDVTSGRVTVLNQITDTDGVRNSTYFLYADGEGTVLLSANATGGFNGLSPSTQYWTRTGAETLNGSTRTWTSCTSPLVTFTTVAPDFPATVLAPTFLSVPPGDLKLVNAISDRDGVRNVMFDLFADSEGNALIGSNETGVFQGQAAGVTFWARTRAEALDGTSGSWTILTSPIASSLGSTTTIPTAHAGGPYVVLAYHEGAELKGGDLVLDGSGSTAPGGSLVSYSWDINGDGVFGDLVSVNPTLTWAQLTTLLREAGLTPEQCLSDTFPSGQTKWQSIALRVTDSSNHTSDALAQLTIAREEPVAQFVVQPDRVPEWFGPTFDASGSHHGNSGHSIVRYEWDFDIPAAILASQDIYQVFNAFCVDAIGRTVTHRYPTIGTYHPVLKVTDDQGRFAFSFGSTVIVGIDAPPIAVIGGPYAVEIGQDLRPDGSRSSVMDASGGNTLVTYSWDLNGDGVFDDAVGVNPMVTWARMAQLLDPSQYPVDPIIMEPGIEIRLRVTDARGLQSEARTMLYVLRPDPVAVPLWYPLPSTPIDANGFAHVLLNGSSSYSWGNNLNPQSVVNWSWRAQDGSASAFGDLANMTLNLNPLPSPMPSEGLERTLVLAVTNSAGRTHETEFNVNFKFLPSRPPAISFPAGSCIQMVSGGWLNIQMTLADPDGNWIGSVAWDLNMDGSFETTWNRIDTNGDGGVDSADLGPPTLYSFPWVQLGNYPGLQSPGKHLIRVQVTDSTGTTSEAFVTLVILPKS